MGPLSLRGGTHYLERYGLIRTSHWLHGVDFQLKLSLHLNMRPIGALIFTL